MKRDNELLRERHECVTWHRGTLWPYESMAAVGAKFCYLNKVSPRRFIEYLRTFCPGIRTGDLLSVLDDPQADLGAFASSLGEHVANVRKLKASRFYPPEFYAVPRERPSSERVGEIVQIPFNGSLRYCPTCARMGFLASFHHIPIFRKCLLHGDALLQFTLRSAVWPCRNDNEKGIANAHAFLFESRLGWDFKRGSAWIPSIDPKADQLVMRYLKLAEQACRKSREISSHCLSTEMSLNANERSGIDVLRWHIWPKRMTADLESRLEQEAVSAVLVTKEVLACPRDQSLTNLFQEVPLDQLVEIRRQSALLFGEDVAWHRLAVSAIKEMIRGHEACWASYIRFRDDRRAEDLALFDNEIRWICPRVVAVQKIQDWWLTPQHLRPETTAYGSIDAFSSEFARALDLYGQGQKVSVAFFSNSADEEPRIFNRDAWRIDEQLREVTDAVLDSRLRDDLWNARAIEDQLLQIPPEGKHKTWNMMAGSRTVANVAIDFTPYRSALYVFERPPGGLELRVWTRTPESLPSWGPGSERHNGAEQIWKHGALEGMSKASELPSRRQYENPGYADHLASKNWKTYGRPIVARMQ